MVFLSHILIKSDKDSYENEVEIGEELTDFSGSTPYNAVMLASFPKRSGV